MSSQATADHDRPAPPRRGLQVRATTATRAVSWHAAQPVQLTLAQWLAEPFSLAMSSGFFSFFAHTGVVSTLEEHGLVPRRVSGSSAGALVTGAFAAGLGGERLAVRLGALRRADFWDPRPGPGLLRGARFDRLLRELLPVDTFEACRIPAAISVFDLRTAATEVVTAGDLVAAIRASCAVPLLFHPVRAGGRLRWDGGILDRPGLRGMPTGERVLYHHITSRSPWRRRQSLEVPRRPGMVTLRILGLPRSGPFRLDDGRRALALARRATERALGTPIGADGTVDVEV